MSEMEEKIGAILNDPKMMQQIMSMAQAMNQSQSQQASKEPSQQRPEPAPSGPSPQPFDPRMLQSLAGIAQKTGVDQNQQVLLKALCPYLSQNRVGKLERAMRAAKMAGMASSFLNSGGLQLLTGR